MSNIKFRLEKWEGNTIVFQILEMNEAWRISSLSDYFNSIKNENKFIKNIRSHTMPELPKESTDIFLRGLDKSKDFNVVSKGFKSKEDCGIAYDEIISLFKEASDHWNKINESNDKEIENSNIYEF